MAKKDMYQWSDPEGVYNKERSYGQGKSSRSLAEFIKACSVNMLADQRGDTVAISKKMIDALVEGKYKLDASVTPTDILALTNADDEGQRQVRNHAAQALLKLTGPNAADVTPVQATLLAGVMMGRDMAAGTVSMQETNLYHLHTRFLFEQAQDEISRHIVAQAAAARKSLGLNYY